MPILADGTIKTTEPEVIFAAGPTNELDRTFDTDVISFEIININRVTMFNKILGMQTVVLYVKKKFGEIRKLRQYQLKMDESAEYLVNGEFISLQPGDVLEVETTDADAIDYVVYGDLE